MRLRTLPRANPTLPLPDGSARPDEPSDAELLARLRSGETVALDHALRRYWSPLIVFLIRHTGSRETAEDMAQRTFCQLWDRRMEWRADGSLRGLLYRMARNFAISDRRHADAESRAVAVLAEWIPSSTTPLQLLESQQLRQELSAAVQALPARRREVFILRCVHDLSYREIAEVMGTSPQTVANQLSSALSTLRGTLSHLLGD
ncbi:MAG TPA: sigma-70 family RNA polymerase sigma factor [Gemmatimonadaceae bacterium]|nr:sigma-70 family RNA polymerase sigma factor [Gemmatimonadaceae bacterium]